LADELAPQLVGQIPQRERGWPGGGLQPAPLSGEVLGQPPLVLGEPDFSGEPLLAPEPLEESRRRTAQYENLLRRPVAIAGSAREVQSAPQGFERHDERPPIEGE